MGLDSENNLVEGVDFIYIEIPDLSDLTADQIEGLKEIPKKKLRLFNSIKPHRLEYETSEEYKFRRKLNKKLIKTHLKYGRKRG